MEQAIIDISQLIEAANRLPPLPASLTQLAAIVATDDFALRDLIDVVSYDPVLTARLLRAANSASSAAASEVATVRDAVVRLGAGPVLAIAMGGTVGSRVRRSSADAATVASLWSHSVATAVACEVVKGFAAVEVPVAAMTAALLHDIGKLVLAETLTPHILQLLEEVAAAENLDTKDAEMAVLLVDHGELGAVASRAWQLPEDITDAIEHHHTPEELTRPVVAAVALADVIAHDLIGTPLSDEALRTESLAALHISEASYDVLTATACERNELLADQFG